MMRSHGVWAASLTPLTQKLEPDLDLLAEHASSLVEEGCEGILLFGTTGEAPSFSVRERQAALEGLLSRNFDPARLMVGTGCSAMTDTIELTRHALSLGVEKVLMIPPFFLKEPLAVGVWDSYREIIERVDSSDWQLYLYNFPRLSGVPITVDLITSLREFHGDLVVGVKDSSGDIRSLHSFLALPDFSVMPGNERLLMEGVRLGAAGVITATANINAAAIESVYRELVDGSIPDDTTMLAAREVIDRYGPIPSMKAALAKRTGHAGWNRVRPPLVPLTGESEMRVSWELEALTT